MNFDFRSKQSHLFRATAGLGMLAARHHRVALAVVALLTVASLPFALDIRYDDDVIQFLPEGDPEVDRFRRIGERFHGLSIALVGLDSRDGDIFEPAKLEAIRNITRDLSRTPGVAFATSVTEVRDVAEATASNGEKMAVVDDLVGDIPVAGSPAAAAELHALRERVMSRNLIRGQLVSEDGGAALLLAYIEPEADQKQTADGIQSAVHEHLNAAGEPFVVHFGGAPFIGSYVADGARRDMNRLAPFVALAIVLIVLFTARSTIGALVALASVGVGIAWLMGLMSGLGRPLTLVSSSLPVLLVALGSAYSIHLLTRILEAIDAGSPTKLEAIRVAVEEVGPPIFAAGLTTALGFLSFLAMDIRPMREFGVWMAVGTLMVVALALVVVPAACAWLPLRARSGGRAPRGAIAFLARVAATVIRRPIVVGAMFAGLIAVFMVGAVQVDTHMETKNFFEPDSPPVLAENFLEERLGGSLFLQIQVKGDIKHPAVLRQIDRLGMLATSLPNVGSVQSIVEPVLLGSQAMIGAERIPSSEVTSRAVTTLLDDDPNIRLLVDPEWEHALVVVKLAGFDTEVASQLANELAERAESSIAGPRAIVERSAATERVQEAELVEVLAHVSAVLQTHGVGDVSEAQLRAALSAEARPSPEALRALVSKVLRQVIVDDEMLYLRADAELASAASAISAAWSGALPELGDVRKALFAIASDEERESDEALTQTAQYVIDNFEDAAKEGLKTDRAKTVANEVAADLPPAALRDLRRALAPLSDDWASVPLVDARGIEGIKTTGVGVQVSGYPMVYAGMNESVRLNQERSLVLSSLLVLAALTWFFRSLLLAFVVALPAGFTLLVTFGTMGHLGLPMDVGTSMIASIALGVGLDYAVHLTWSHGPDGDLPATMSATGWGIVINALEVAVGFGILAFGTIVPMRHFGLLTALAMLVSAGLSLAVLPALLRAARALGGTDAPEAASHLDTPSPQTLATDPLAKEDTQ